MLPSNLKSRAVGLLAGAIVVTCLSPAAALAERQRDKAPEARSAQSAATDPGQHGAATGHLPPVRTNLEVVSMLELAGGAFADVLPEQIADVAVYKNYAYVNSRLGEDCARCGFFVVDISNPAAPHEVTFVRSLPGNFPGEGAHVITINTPTFQGDVLAVNNEFSTSSPTVGGGFDLFDVSDPRNPRPLARGVGDRCEDFENPCLVGAAAVANDYHSVFIWQHGDKAYAVGVDNADVWDVDIFDITNPVAPVPVAEHWLLDLYFDQLADEAPFALGGNYNAVANVFNHDMVVKNINGRAVMLVSYWDAGYVQLDVTDPANPTFLGDTEYDGPDPEFPQHAPAEGNAHYAEFSHDNQFFLGADEDFAPERVAGNKLTVTSGERAGDYPAYTIGGAAPISALADDVLNGPTVYGGYACPDPDGIGPSTGSPAVPQRSSYDLNLQSGEEAILVVQRGPTNDPEGNPDIHDYNNNGDLTDDACFPGEKADVATDAGWDAVLVVNRHTGDLSVPYCGSGAFPSDEVIVAICGAHTALHALFPDTPTTGAYNEAGTHNPPVGATGQRFTAAGAFDGWGYLHLYRNAADANGNFPEIDTHAVAETKDPAKATGFGDLSIHEIAADPTEYLAYSSYYSAGVRVFRFGDGGIEETGAFIPEGGANVWGIEQFTGADQQRYIVASDRDFGLYILRYTGPGAAQPPVCTDATTRTRHGTPLRNPIGCSDANGNPLTFSLVSGPGNGTVQFGADGTLTYTPTFGFSGVDVFEIRAFDGAAFSNTATYRVTVGTFQESFFTVIPCNPAGATLVGTPGDDLMRCGPGNDTLNGLAGNDLLFGEGGNDRLIGGEGEDLLDGGDGNDSADGGLDPDTISGGLGNDVLSGGNDPDTIHGGAGRNRLSGGHGADGLDGGPSTDRISGGSGADEIVGNAGADVITAGKGEDTVDGGRGNDRINSRDGRAEVIECGTGRDTVTADRKDILSGCERRRFPRRR